MQMYEIITKKKQGQPLTREEINYVVNGFTSGEVADYQMSSLLMAICLKGMTEQETTDITMAMVASGDTLDLSRLRGKTLDKHSTGGVGDKTSLIVVPIIAALGFPMSKMSGRGLGHTGGTVDKLEAIPGFKTGFTTEEFLGIVERYGICIAGQSGNMVPADKKMYALRDVTATVDSIPLIAASIMSKKIAAGAEHILLDVKTGNGAFMKDYDDAKKLAEAMVAIGIGCGRKTAALITNMSAPLGRAVGNSLEVIEAVQVLACDPNAAQDLVEVCIQLATHMLYIAEVGSLEVCEAKVMEVLKNGKAREKLAEMVAAQGGDRTYIDDPLRFDSATYSHDVKAPASGFIGETNTTGVGIAAMKLGAGREKHDDDICYTAGIILHAKHGDPIEAGQTIATLYTNDSSTFAAAEKKFLESVQIISGKPAAVPMVFSKVGVT